MKQKALVSANNGLSYTYMGFVEIILLCKWQEKTNWQTLNADISKVWFSNAE